MDRSKSGTEGDTLGDAVTGAALPLHTCTQCRPTSPVVIRRRRGKPRRAREGTGEPRKARRAHSNSQKPALQPTFHTLGRAYLKAGERDAQQGGTR